MPNRILKETVKYSEQIDSLSWFEEVLFYRLIVSADDYGCLDGRITVLKNSLFPTKDTVTKKAVEDGIRRLTSTGLLQMYEVSGKPYLFFPTWEKHQRVRNKHRKYPSPPQESTCQSFDGQLTASCQSESESNPNPNPNPNPTPAGAFDEFWNAYPVKKAKEAARAAFDRVTVPVDTLLDAIEKQKNSEIWTRDGGKYIPFPAKWLEQGRWEDEITQSAPSGSTSTRGYEDPEMLAYIQQLHEGESL